MVDHATPGDLREFLGAFLVWYDRADELDPGEAFSLLDTVHFMPFDKLSEEELGKIAKFALIESQSGEPDVRIASWRAFKLLTAYQPDHPCCAEIGVCVRAAQVEDNITMTFLKYRVLSNLGEDTAREQELLYDRDVVSDISWITSKQRRRGLSSRPISSCSSIRSRMVNRNICCISQRISQTL